MKKLSLLLFVVIFAIEAIYCQVHYDSCVFKVSKEQLISELARYSEYWINDSLAKNGFRRLFGREFFRCSGKELEGTSWDSIAVYLGKPHFTFKSSKNFLYSKDEILHRYVLHTYGDYRNFNDIGNLILDIIVVKGVVKWISIAENDG